MIESIGKEIMSDWRDERLYLETEKRTWSSEKAMRARMLYHLIVKFGPLTRDAIVEDTGIPRSTVYDSLSVLMKAGLVRKTNTRVPNKIGRPVVTFEGGEKTGDK